MYFTDDARYPENMPPLMRQFHTGEWEIDAIRVRTAALLK